MKPLSHHSIALGSLIAGLLLFVVGWCVIPQYFVASDPWRYSQAAFDIAEHGELGPSQIFRHRLGITLPVAVAYGVFGVNVHSTNLWMLICALGMIVVVWCAASDPKSKIIAVVLAGLSAPLWSLSTTLYPDLAAATFMAASVLFLTRRHEPNWPPLLAAVLGTTCLFVAFLAKESAYWVLPLWGFALVEDLRTERGRRFWLTTMLIGAALGAVYLIFCYVAWDDPLARFRSMQSWTGRHLWAWEGEDSGLLARLTIQPPWLFLRTYGVVFVLSLLGLAWCPPQLRYWSYYLMLTIALFWFGSTSFTEYEPLPLAERMILPSLPAMLILSAEFLAQLAQRMKHVTVAVVFAALIVANMLLHSTALVFATAFADEAHETKAAAFLRNEVANANERVLVVTSDERSPESLAFFFGYEPPANLALAKAVGFDESLDLQSFTRVYVFMSETRSQYLLKSYNAPHADAEIAAMQLPIAFRSGDIRVFSVPLERRDELSTALARLDPSHRPGSASAKL